MASAISENNYFRNSVERLTTPAELHNNTKPRGNIRQFLIQLLAMKPYTKADLIEEANDHERSSLPTILADIARLLDDLYILHRHMWQYVDENWPLYTEQERLEVKRNKRINVGLCLIAHQTALLEYEHQPPSKRIRISQLGTNPTSTSHSSHKDYTHQVEDSKKINSVCKDVIKHPQEQPPPELDILAQSVQQTQSMEHEYQPRPKKIENAPTPSSPETRKKRRLIELFGEDPITPVKSTIRDHKKMTTDTDLPKKSCQLRMSASPATLSRQRMAMELFGEYSDDSD